MPRHDARCKCGFEGEIFKHITQDASEIECPECKGRSLELLISGVRTAWERTWNEENGTSTQLKCRPENVASVRKRLAACGLDDAHNVVKSDGRFVVTDRSTQRRLAQAVKRCQEQDRGDKERLGMYDAARQWADL